MERLPNLLVERDYHNIRARVEALTAKNQALWGNMDVAQMMAHCNNSLEQTISGGGKKQMLIGMLISWMFKKNYIDESDIKKNAPTAPDFKVVGPREFANEHIRLLKNLSLMHEIPEHKLEGIISPFFGKLSGYECARLQYKHLNHHLSQFSA
jgi:Protein of unknown function (DUF1569)